MLRIFDFSSQCRQSEIARDAETVANTAPIEILKKKLPQRHCCWKWFAADARRPFGENWRRNGVGSVAGGQADSFPYRYSRIR
jgi:hypothetical protein